MESKNGFRKMKFKLRAPSAKKVALTGDFKNWSQEGIPMKKSLFGIWNVGLDLQPGIYEYKFIVDGDWRTDPKNRQTSSTDIGTTNSVIKV